MNHRPFCVSITEVAGVLRARRCYFCLTIDRSGGVDGRRGGNHAGTHRIGRAPRRRHRRRVHRRGPRPRPAAGRRPPGGRGGLVARHHRRGRGPPRRRAGLRRRGAGDLARRRRRAHLHPEPPARSAGPGRPRGRQARGVREAARHRPRRGGGRWWPPPTGRAPSPRCRSSTASTRWSARRGPGSPTVRSPCAWSTAATCRTGCRPTQDDNWRVDAELSGPSRAFADIGSHWCDLVEFVTGDRLAVGVRRAGDRGARARARRAPTPSRRPAAAGAAGPGARSPPRTWPWCCSAPSAA